MSEPSARAERVSEFLERLAKGESLAGLEAMTGEEREDLALAGLGQALAEALPARPANAYRARLQAALQAELAAGHSPPARRGWAAGRWLPRLAATALAVLLVFASAVAASASSLPGEPLYGLKRAVEATRLRVAWNPTARAAIELDLADARLREIAALRQAGRALPSRLVAEVAEAHAAAAAAAQASGDDGLVARVAARVAEDERSLEALVDRPAPAPPPLVPPPATALPTATREPSPSPAPTVAPSETATRPRPAGGEAAPTVAAVAPTGTPSSVPPEPPESPGEPGEPSAVPLPTQAEAPTTAPTPAAPPTLSEAERRMTQRAVDATAAAATDTPRPPRPTRTPPRRPTRHAPPGPGEWRPTPLPPSPTPGP